MNEPREIRLATAEDATSISNIVKDTIRISNSKDYPPSVIERVVANFPPETVLQLMDSRTVWVAVNNGDVIGTASLDGDTVRTVFVSPSAQGSGVGQRLMQTMEAAALEKNLKVLRVPASLTARNFYARLGYNEVREVVFGEERTFLMEKSLT